MKKAILTLFFCVAFFSLFFVPEELNGLFILDEAIKLAIWVLSGKALDKIK